MHIEKKLTVILVIHNIPIQIHLLLSLLCVLMLNLIYFQLLQLVYPAEFFVVVYFRNIIILTSCTFITYILHENDFIIYT